MVLKIIEVCPCGTDLLMYFGRLVPTNTSRNCENRCNLGKIIVKLVCNYRKIVLLPNATFTFFKKEGVIMVREMDGQMEHTLRRIGWLVVKLLVVAYLTSAVVSGIKSASTAPMTADAITTMIFGSTDVDDIADADAQTVAESLVSDPSGTSDSVITSFTSVLPGGCVPDIDSLISENFEIAMSD